MLAFQLCLPLQDLTQDCKALAGGGDPVPPGELQAGFGAGAVIGSEELGKQRAVIKSIGLDSKHHKERKITEGRTGVGLLWAEAIILWGTCTHADL